MLTENHSGIIRQRDGELVSKASAVAEIKDQRIMHAQDLENAAAILALKTEAEKLTQRLNEISLKLNNNHGMDITLSSWDWMRPSHTAKIMPQGNIHLTLVNMADRPK